MEVVRHMRGKQRMVQHGLMSDERLKELEMLEISEPYARTIEIALVEFGSIS